MTNTKSKKKVLLINLGSPQAPTREAVHVYLKQFLMDPYVIDIPFLFRWFLINGIILRKRPRESAKAYAKIWKDGSPLIQHSAALKEKVQEQLGDDYAVELGMRYGHPSISEALNNLEKENGSEPIIVVPLYPQYSLAATESCIQETRVVAKKMKIKNPLHFVGTFYHRDDFLSAFTAHVEQEIKIFNPDHVIFSFHGLPERHIKKTDTTKNYCLKSKTCCETLTEKNKNCYRAQSFFTARGIAQKLNLSAQKYSVSFQSRLGRTPWIKPYTDFLYKELADRGVKKILVVSPSFVADCLETLEEIALRGRDDFIAHGGADLRLVPSLNSSKAWVQVVSDLVMQQK